MKSNCELIRHLSKAKICLKVNSNFAKQVDLSSYHVDSLSSRLGLLNLICKRNAKVVKIVE